MEKPWRCMQTGECCRVVRSVTVTPQEVDALRAARPDVTLDLRTLPDGFMQFKAGPCPFLAEDGRCGVYAARPLNCRRYMCGRMSPGEPYVDHAVVPLTVLTNRDLRRQYALNQRKAMAKWGHQHGWTDL